MVEKHEMIVIGISRYRYDDARRLGLVADGKVITANSVERPPAVTYATGYVPAVKNADGTPENAGDDVTDETETPQDDAQDADGERPSRNASKGKWKAYALSQGHTEDELAELTRDQISELFPDSDSESEISE